jgi:hypothetical protein
VILKYKIVPVLFLVDPAFNVLVCSFTSMPDVLSPIGDREKYGGWETTVMLVLVKNSLGEKGSVR